jgi:hypothetical protein
MASSSNTLVDFDGDMVEDNLDNYPINPNST